MKKYFWVLLATYILCGLLSLTGCKRGNDETGLSWADSLRAQAERLAGADSNNTDPSQLPQDEALCQALAGYSPDSIARVSMLLGERKANPNCFCALFEERERFRLLNKIPIVKRYVPDGEVVSEFTDPMTLALETDDWALIDTLIAYGGKMNGEGAHEPLLDYVIRYDYLKGADKLIARGADPKLAHLYEVGSKAMAQKLLDLGCPASTIGLNGAQGLRDKALSAFLLSQNPKPYGTLYATGYFHPEPKELGYITFLMDEDDRAGVEIEWDGRSFGEVVVQYGDCEMLRRLAQRGFDPNDYVTARPPIYEAIYDDDTAMVRCLLELGARTEFPDYNAMEEAIGFNRVGTVRLLNSLGKKVREGNNLSYAKEYGAKPETIAVLEGK